METPHYHEGLPQNEEQAKAEAIRRVDEISAWFRDYQVVAPVLRIVRQESIIFLRGHMSIAEIARVCNIQEQRVREVLKGDYKKAPGKSPITETADPRPV